ncbi:MAG: P-II family nitrogen regulator [Candidatus Sumerlaeota bacterium]|nr:P-II family nitrogen regulator [Candidatus Sumerlaeota bacterium]
MKMLRCIVQPYKMEDLRAALEDIGGVGMTIYEVKGHGRQKGHKEVYRGAEYQVSFLPKMMVEVALPDERVDEVVEKIIQTVRTGQIGDGKIFISDLEEVVRIRTSERGIDAL